MQQASGPVSQSAAKSVPHLFHIGTGRAGSTFLFHLIKNHPNISLSKNQEIGYYSDNFDRGGEWYAEQFGAGVRIDTSPAYFARGSVVAERIQLTLAGQSPKFLLVLRNPIDYTYSHYLMRRNIGYFEKHRDLYPRIPSSCIDLFRTYPKYFERGRYFELLKSQWLPYFDKSSFKIVLFSDLVGNPQSTVDNILDFWGLAPIPVKTPEISKNTTLRYPFLYKARSRLVKHTALKNTLKESSAFNWLYSRFLVGKKDLTPKERLELWSYFADDVANLSEFTGIDLSGRWRPF